MKSWRREATPAPGVAALALRATPSGTAATPGAGVVVPPTGSRATRGRGPVAPAPGAASTRPPAPPTPTNN